MSIKKNDIVLHIPTGIKMVVVSANKEFCICQFNIKKLENKLIPIKELKFLYHNHSSIQLR